MKLHFRFENHNAVRTLVLLHGFMGRSGDWHFLAKRLTECCNVLLVDLPAHGKSLAHDDEASQAWEIFFGELDGILQKLRLKHICLLGYSMGGRLALQWAVNNPQRTEKLILESANPGIANAEERRLRLQNDLALSAKMQSPEFDFERFLKDWYAQPLFANLNRHPAFADLLRQRLQNDPLRLAWALNAFSVGRQENIWPRLADMRQPTLLICGAADEKYMRISERMQRCNPKFKRQVAEHCGHNVHFENPEWFARQVTTFCTQAP